MAWKISSFSHQICIQHLLCTRSPGAKHAVVIKVDIILASWYPVVEELSLMSQHYSQIAVTYLGTITAWII